MRPILAVSMMVELGWFSFEILQGASNWQTIEKNKKWSYLDYFSLNLKNKTTFFSSTFKVEKNKVVLFFHFELK